MVSKMPLVLRVSEIWPLKRKPRFVKSMRMFRTISPRYIPLHIFSYLETKGIKSVNVLITIKLQQCLLMRVEYLSDTKKYSKSENHELFVI